MTMCGLDHLVDRHHRAESIRDVRDGDQAGLWSQQLLVLIEQYLAGIVYRGNAEQRALFRAQHLPRNNVGMVLEPCDDDLVVFLNVASPPALRDKIDRLCGTTDKDDFTRCSCIKEAARLLSGGLICIGGACGQLMSGAVHVRVLVFVEIADSIDDRLWLLGGRAVIKPDERVAIDDFPENGKIATNCLDVEGDRRELKIGQNRGLSGTRRNHRRSTRRIKGARLVLRVM